MQLRPIPLTDLRVSPICLGTMTFGSPVGEADAVRLVHHALDRGVNFLDTANIYEGYARVVGSDGGVAETILGRALQGRRDAVVATKVGMKIGSGPDDEHTGAPAIRRQLDASLRRLAVDRIDLYYLHRPDPVTPLAETLAALAEAIRAGKIRHYGVSNYSAPQLAELLAVADRLGLPRPVAHQPPLSYLKPEAVADLLPLCARERIAVVPYQVLQGGLLTGKYRRDQPPPADSRMAEKPAWLPAPDAAWSDRLEVFEREARAANRTPAQQAVHWALRQPAVVSAIVGVKHLAQLDESIAAAR
ncbi:MAG: aldo/keto reductase [Opitutaceae bacterium]|nr:aldo/keto reductase [Opitutaceae bacterium]